VSLDSKMMMLRAQLYTAMQTLEGDKLKEFWDLIEEIRVAGGVLRLTTVAQAHFTSEDGKTIYYWPYCPTCKQPYSFDDEEPLANCDCGTSEWGYPRPAEWIPDPNNKLDAEYAFAYRELLRRGEIPEGRPGMPRDSMG
jgi:hypothetical protein